MLMSDNDIRSAIRVSRITIDPLDERMIQPSSIDIRLGNHFVYSPTWVDGNRIIDPEQDNSDLFQEIKVPDGGDIHVKPNEFLLGHTVETVGLTDRVAAQLEGRSSLGRLGLMIHSTAGFIDPGFKGQITLEISNLSPFPIRLRPGMRIGQICFFFLASAAAEPYGAREGSKYQGQQGATSSRIHHDKW